MIKAILITTAFDGEPIDFPAHVTEFRNGKYITEAEHTKCSNFWIECTLPAVPLVDSLVELGSIEYQDMLAQLIEVYNSVEGFRDLVQHFRDKKKKHLGDITIEDALKYFCGYENMVDNVYSGNWYVDRVCFRANEEYIYIEMHHES